MLKKKLFPINAPLYSPLDVKVVHKTLYVERQLVCAGRHLLLELLHLAEQLERRLLVGPHVQLVPLGEVLAEEGGDGLVERPAPDRLVEVARQHRQLSLVKTAGGDLAIKQTDE